MMILIILIFLKGLWEIKIKSNNNFFKLLAKAQACFQGGAGRIVAHTLQLSSRMPPIHIHVANVEHLSSGYINFS